VVRPGLWGVRLPFRSPFLLRSTNGPNCGKQCIKKASRSWEASELFLLFGVNARLSLASATQQAPVIGSSISTSTTTNRSDTCILRRKSANGMSIRPYTSGVKPPAGQRSTRLNAGRGTTRRSRSRSSPGEGRRCTRTLRRHRT
jgi:hypothetical protein